MENLEKTNGRKLISTTDFVLEQKEHIKEVDKLSFFEIQIKINEFYDKVVHHATQMKRVLEKRMFVSCGEEPIYTTNHSEECYCRKCEDETRRCTDLQNKRIQAEKYVLFKGFYSVDEKTVSNGEIEIIFGNLITLMIHRNHGSEGITKEKMFIEDLVDYNLTITDDF